ncbi:MAG: hypothetical protein IKO54_09460 [Lachnospiraceae bacterium]|nr:hypothetical protein [Lachnospiraceae bacterium]
MKKYVLKALIYIGIFIAAYGLMLGFLTLSAGIKTESIQEKMEESADYLCEDIVFPYMESEEVKPSCIDRYADSILLNIAYNFEADDKLKSVMWSSYYYTYYQNENANLYDTVYKGQEKNNQYLRYWHGSAGVMRVLHTFLNIKQIYIWHGVLFVILFTVLAALLVRFHCTLYAVLLGFSLIAVSFWYVPFSLEYTWSFLCMFIFSIAAVIMTGKGKDEHIGILFMLSGMLTIFLDFLTTETVSLMIPLMLALIVRRKRAQGGLSVAVNFKTEILYSIKAAILWGIGYVGMWVMKWITASIVIGENVMPYVTEHIEERMAGNLGDMSIFGYLWLSVKRNVTCVFPLDYGLTGAIIAGVLFVIILYFTYVYHKKKIDWKYIIFFLVLGLVPYLRILVMRNHSVLHYFFVHRALCISVFAFLIGAADVIDGKKLFKKKKRLN